MKETLPLCPLLYADHRQRCFTLRCPPHRQFCVLFGKERGERNPPLERFHGQCCCCDKTRVHQPLFKRPCERPQGNDRPSGFISPSISGRRLTQLQGYEDPFANSKPVTHDSWQSVVIRAQQMVSHVEILFDHFRYLKSKKEKKGSKFSCSDFKL